MLYIAAGLRRVEVFVPADRVDSLKAYAAQLREGSESEAVKEARKPASSGGS